MEALFLVMLFGLPRSVVLLTQGMRKIPVQYAKRNVGRKQYGGVSTHIPLRVNSAGVMPIIFAQSIMFIPSSIATFLPEGGFRDAITNAFGVQSFVYSTLTFVLIVFFTYFYTAIILKPCGSGGQHEEERRLYSLVFVPASRPRILLTTSCLR
jgi:preprotein translocase subunit SecY